MQEIPLEELNAGEDTKIVSLFHYSKDPARTHGVPCKFVVIENEPFSETKTRLQQRLGVADKDFARYRFALVSSTMFKQPSPIEDGESSISSAYRVAAPLLICDLLDDVLYDHKWTHEDALGLDHPDRRPNKVSAEKGIVMR